MSNPHPTYRRPLFLTHAKSAALSTALVLLVASAPRARAVVDQNTADESGASGAILNKPEKLGAFRDLGWKLQPDTLVTRGAIETPEQRLPDKALPDPWEACFTLGTQWQFKPTNESYKSGTQLIEMLIETRAKGGNLLLNVIIPYG